MPWIETVSESNAAGILKRLYEQAVARSGRIWNIVRIQSLNPPVLRDSIRLYQTIMYGESPLTRSQREMLATVVSATAGCRY